MEDDEDDLGLLFDQTGNARDDEPRPAVGHNRGMEPEDALDEMDLEDVMKEGRKLLMTDLIRAVKGGYASPAEKNTLRQMLKDNGMVMGDPTEGATPGEGKKKADLPSFDRPEYDR